MTLLSEASFLVTPNGYKASKLYAAIPTNGNGDMTFTRATTATRVDENNLVSSVASNVPRIDYTGGGCPSILLEPQRTNQSLNSNDISQIGTLNSPSSVINTSGNYAESPDGTENATRVVASATGFNYALISSTAITSTSGDYVGSIYLKSNNGSNQNVAFYGRNASVNYVTITPNWERYNVLGSASSNFINFGARTSYGSDSSLDFLAWGLQIEHGSYATSLIPTVASTVTRNADVINRDDIYTNNLITAAGGTWFIELNNNIPYTRDNFSYGIFLNTLNNSNGNGFNITNGIAGYRLIINKVLNGIYFVSYITLTDVVKIAIKWNGSRADIFENGVKVITATPFTSTNMEFLSGNGSDVPKYIKSQLLFPTPLTDSECQALTTL